MIVVMGAGSVGSLLGGILKKHGNEVALIGSQKHMEQITKNGLYVQGEMNFKEIIPAFIDLPSFLDYFNKSNGLIDYILMTTKAHQTAKACKDLIRIVSPETAIVAIQNGLDTEKIIQEHFPENTVLRGITSIGVCRPSPGLVDYTGKGITAIGYFSEKGKKEADKLIDLVYDPDFQVKLENNILGAVYTKTIVNCALNPLTAIHQVKNIEVYKRKDLRKKAQQLAAEAWLVAQKQNISLIVEDPIEFTFEVIKKTGNNINSMLSDIQMRRKTEIDFLNGKIVTLGKQLGLNVTYNEKIYSAIISLEQNLGIA
jgi:2-dehydropantoate 2-reductase